MACDEAHVQFDDSTASVSLRYRTSSHLLISISCREPDWQLSSIEQVCNSSLSSPSTVEDLYVEREPRDLRYYSDPGWKYDTIPNTLWLQLLLPFTAVKNLYLSREFALDIAAALQELVGGRITEVLPSLQTIFVEWFFGSIQVKIGQFLAARQLSGHPVAISDWRRG